MATFGHTTAETTDASIEDSYYGCVFTCPENGIATSITARIRYSLAFCFGYSKCAIYQWNGGVNPSKVAESEVYTIDASDPAFGTEWHTYNLTTNPNLTSGTEYLLLVWGDESSGIAANAIYTKLKTPQVGYTEVTKSLAYGAWPDPLAAFSQAADVFVQSIYCTYTPTVTGILYTKQSGTFGLTPIKVKIGGAFAEKSLKVKVGGVFI